MRRVICFLCLLLCLPVLAGSAPAQEETVQEEQTVLFPMDAVPEEKIGSSSVILIERDLGETLYERNADERIYPASTTKVMTALCVVNAIDDLDGTG